MSDALSDRLARWSRRKAAARRGGALPEEPDQPRAADARSAEAEAEASPVPSAPPAADAAADHDTAPAAADAALPDLPPIDQLDFQSDFTAFMAKNVPEAIRRAALRKLWVSDPVLANLDGLNDYDEDHHLIDMSITADQTSYKVGKGYFDEVQERLAESGESPPGESPSEQARSADSPSTESRSAESQPDPAGEPLDHTVSNNDADEDAASAAPQHAMPGSISAANSESVEDREK